MCSQAQCERGRWWRHRRRQKELPPSPSRAGSPPLGLQCAQSLSNKQDQCNAIGGKHGCMGKPRWSSLLASSYATSPHLACIMSNHSATTRSAVMPQKATVATWGRGSRRHSLLASHHLALIVPGRSDMTKHYVMKSELATSALGGGGMQNSLLAPIPRGPTGSVHIMPALPLFLSLAEP